MVSGEGVTRTGETIKSGSGNKLPIREPELKREYYFRALVLSHLLNTIRESLEDSGFLQSEVDVFTTELAKLDEDDQFSVLSIPFELRGRVFEKYHEDIEDRRTSVANAVRDICQKNKKYGFTVGYHLSDHHIPKANNGAWDIKGNEFDDRDNRWMAYYSEDYLNRYKKKSGKYLYVVRAEISPDSSHKRDLSNKWGRASLLSIIDECDMREIEQGINEAIKNEDAAPQREAA